MPSKRGQLTLFIMIGVFVLILLVAAVYLNSYLQAKKSEKVLLTTLKLAHRPEVITPTVCADGTEIGSCSKTKPFFCNKQKRLVADCQRCGCFPGSDCLPDGTCTKPIFTEGNFTIYFLPINYAPNESGFLSRVAVLKELLQAELGLSEKNFVIIDESLFFPTTECNQTASQLHRFVDVWAQKRTGAGLGGVKFTAGIPIYDYRIIGLDKNNQSIENCGCGYTFMYSPLIYIGGAACSLQQNALAHEIGHSFGLCDEYDTCVWQATSLELSNAYGHPCFNKMPDENNSNCGKRCCAGEEGHPFGKACCAGKYADKKEDGWFSYLGSSNIPPPRRSTAEMKAVILEFLCTNLGVCQDV
ncbi:MAG: hypothetical protein QW559_00420 [Candidatus Woesearchaeota archaeon]